MPISTSTPVSGKQVAIAALTSPSPISLIRAPVARTSAISFSWRGRFRMITVRSSTYTPLRSAIARRFCEGLLFKSMAPLAEGPTAILSMYVSGALSRLPLSAMAITLKAFGPPVAVMVVPSRGSRAMSTSGSVESPFPTFSPM